MDQAPAPQAAAEDPSHQAVFWRRLLHRWLIEYNPLYLLSAALVLAGVTLVSRGFAREGAVYGSIGVAAIAEVYSLALIGGAALLMRIGLRRPAVLLSLLAILYQCDLTLHTETSVYLSPFGIAASSAWLALFVGKLFALAWALRLRLSRSAIAVPVVGALGLTIVPHFFHHVTPHVRTVLVASWVFALFAAGLWTSRTVTSRVSLDSTQQAMMRRVLRASWAMMAVLAFAHALFWTSEYNLETAAVWPVALLLATRWIRRELTLWGAVLATLLLVGLLMPGHLAMTSLMAAVTLTLHALRKPCRLEASPSSQNAPYRTHGGEARKSEWLPVSFAPASRQALARLLTGALVCVYVSLWTRGWSGGPWPGHVIALDVLLTLGLAVMFFKVKVRTALVPLLGVYFHMAVQTHLVTAPRTLLQWGNLSVGVGFALLIGSVGASWLMRRRFGIRE
ncbi:MAG: hypothetical protein HY898_31455 [Deltaproteobacteria bacterium]|nr:hypothetical protein [Deltaproteobacteria bacterium]